MPAPRAAPRSPQDGRHARSSAVSRYAARATGAGWVSAAQRKPTSSRAHATTATGGRFPWPTRCRYRRWSRSCACQAWARMRGGLALTPAGQGGPEPRRVAGMPARFDQDPPDVGVAGLGDAPPLRPVPGGVLARDQAEIGHELPGMREALKVPELGEQGHRREGVDPAEAAEPAHPFAVGRGLGQGRNLSGQVRDPGQELFDRAAIFRHGALQRREGEVLTAEPGPVALGPVPALAIDPAVAGQELAEAVPPAQEILLDIFPAPEQIPGRLPRLIRHGDRRELPGPEEADQLDGIPPIGLDPVARLPRRQGRGHDLAGDAEGRELAIEVVAGRPRLVADLTGPSRFSRVNRRRTWRGSFGIERVSGASAPGRRIPSTRVRLLSSMATNMVSFFMTGLLFACGSVPSGTTHAIIR